MASVVTLILCVAAAACANAAASSLRLPSFYGSHMMFQQNVPVQFWGYGTPDTSISVKASWASSTATATVTSTGTWQVTLPAASASTPASTISVSSSSDKLTVTDVLFGDVYVCSGQSNMEISVSLSRNASAEIAAANFPNIRLLQVAMKPAYYNVTTPQKDLNVSMPWVAVTPSSIPTFSGYCYFMGRDIHQAEGVNVGLIQSCWGGTDAQVWMSPQALAQCNASQSDTTMSKLLAPKNPLAATATMALQAMHKSSSNVVRPARQSSTPVQFSGPPTLPSTLWNSMIHPLLPLAIKGMLWDQGESNAGDPVGYVCLLSSLIRDWRVQWNAAADKPFDPEFPAVYRQLHAYPSEGLLGPMRVTMAGILNTPATAMTISYDLGYMASPGGNIHFWNKGIIGHRASLAMRVLGYKRDLAYTGPVATHAEVVDRGSGGLLYFAADVSFANVNSDNPLQLVYPQAPLHGVELECGSGPGTWPNSPWTTTVVTLLNDTAIRVNITLDGTETEKQPTALRYAWWDYPPPGSLRDSTGLPAWPFLLPLPAP